MIVFGVRCIAHWFYLRTGFGIDTTYSSWQPCYILCCISVCLSISFTLGIWPHGSWLVVWSVLVLVDWNVHCLNNFILFFIWSHLLSSALCRLYSQPKQKNIQKKIAISVCIVAFTYFFSFLFVIFLLHQCFGVFFSLFLYLRLPFFVHFAI